MAGTIKDRENKYPYQALCALMMLGLAVGILLVYGVSMWTVLLAAMLLVCPAILLWGIIQLRRQKTR